MHDVVILDRERLVERAIVGVDALERESLRRVEPVIVGFLQRRLSTADCRCRACAAGSSDECPLGVRDFHDQQMRRRLGLRQDVADEARVRPVPRAKRFIVPGSISRARRAPAPGALRDADFGIGVRGRRCTAAPSRQIDRIRRTIVEHAAPLAQIAPRSRRRRAR